MSFGSGFNGGRTRTVSLPNISQMLNKKRMEKTATEGIARVFLMATYILSDTDFSKCNSHLMYFAAPTI
jgi:hypothetical protein